MCSIAVNSGQRRHLRGSSVCTDASRDRGSHEDTLGEEHFRELAGGSRNTPGIF